MSTSLNLLTGYVGILSIAYTAFYNVGSYVAARMVLKLHTPFLLNLLLAILASTALGAVVGIPSLRIKDDYFIIATFAFQVVIFSILNNLVSFTGGPMGLPGIPQPVIFGWLVSSHWEFLLLTAVLATFCLWLCGKIVHSPFGRVLKHGICIHHFRGHHRRSGNSLGFGFRRCMNFLRFIGFPNSVAVNIRQMLYGGLLVAFMLWRPK